MGIFPFGTWSIKTAPRVLHWLLQDPRLLIAIDRLNHVTEDDIQESGLSPSYSRLLSMGPLGDMIAEQLLGRPDVSMMGQPWAMFMPYTELGRPSRTPEDASLIEKALDVGGTFGASLGPLASLAARVTGQTSEFGGSVARTSPYERGAGHHRQPVDRRAGLKQDTRHRQCSHLDEPTRPGSQTRDYTIRGGWPRWPRNKRVYRRQYLIAMDR
jgi:hypothetical protein